MSIRAVKRMTQASPAVEGAGVRLHRGFGFGDTTAFDPFLLFDDFRNDRDRALILFDRGDAVTVTAGDQGIRFLLVSGRPLEEPVAWHGPIVMNTEAELREAFEQIRNGTFIAPPR